MNNLAIGWTLASRLDFPARPKDSEVMLNASGRALAFQGDKVFMLTGFGWSEAHSSEEVECYVQEYPERQSRWTPTENHLRPDDMMGSDADLPQVTVTARDTDLASGDLNDAPFVPPKSVFDAKTVSLGGLL